MNRSRWNYRDKVNTSKSCDKNGLGHTTGISGIGNCGREPSPENLPDVDSAVGRHLLTDSTATPTI